MSIKLLGLQITIAIQPAPHQEEPDWYPGAERHNYQAFYEESRLKAQMLRFSSLVQ